jgi:hypothetical protein
MNLQIRLALLWCVSVLSLNAEQRIIDRTPLGEAVLRSACTSLSCNVRWGLGDPNAELFLVTVADTRDLGSVANSLTTLAGAVNIEVDYPAAITQTSRPIPQSLYQADPVPYFGSTSRYILARPAATAMSSNLPRRSSGSMRHTLTLPWVEPEWLGSSILVWIPTTLRFPKCFSPVMISLETSPRRRRKRTSIKVAGVIHLVAPQARILPLKAFRVDGSGYR